MRHVMSRVDYEEMVVLGGMETAPEMFRRDILAKEYPATIQRAANELRTRGLAATPDVLDHLIESGKIPSPARTRAGRSRWYREDIDAAAEVLAGEGVRTPNGWAWLALNIHPGQARRALLRALKANPGRDEEDFELRLFPDGYLADPVDPFALLVYVFNAPFLKARDAARKALRRK